MLGEQKGSWKIGFKYKNVYIGDQTRIYVLVCEHAIYCAIRSARRVEEKRDGGGRGWKSRKQEIIELIINWGATTPCKWNLYNYKIGKLKCQRLKAEGYWEFDRNKRWTKAPKRIVWQEMEEEEIGLL